MASSRCSEHRWLRSEDLDPEEARAIIDPALKLMIQAARCYDGYVVQSTGDGIFALFGAPMAQIGRPRPRGGPCNYRPRTQTDDPGRAVLRRLRGAINGRWHLRAVRSTDGSDRKTSTQRRPVQLSTPHSN